MQRREFIKLATISLLGIPDITEVSVKVPVESLADMLDRHFIEAWYSIADEDKDIIFAPHPLMTAHCKERHGKKA